MLPAFPVCLLALVLLVTPPDVVASPAMDECETASPRIELSAMPGQGPAPVVCIGAGLHITLRFDSPLKQASVTIHDRGMFEDLALGRQTLTLVPRDNLVAGEQTVVEVCFADDAAPTCSTLVLVVHPGLGMQEVKVLRQPQPVAHFQQIAQEAKADVERCRAEVKQLRAECKAPDGLRGVIASSLVAGEHGVAVKDLYDTATWKQGDTVTTGRVNSYRSWERIAVSVSLFNQGMEPWTAAGAVLRGLKGEVLKPLALWQLGPLPAAGKKPADGGVIVEFMASETQAQGAYTLILWDADRQHSVTLSNVTFPQ